MIISSERLIEKFYDQIKHKYPDLTFVQVAQICRAPFMFLKKQMAMSHLPVIKYMYWGTYSVKKKRAEIKARSFERIANAYPQYERFSKKKMDMSEVLKGKINSDTNTITSTNLNSHNDEQK